MKPGAKKGLVALGVIYAILVALMAWNMAKAQKPSVDLAGLQQRLDMARQWAREQDPERVRATELTAKEAEAVLHDILAPRGQIVGINYTLIIQCLNFGVLLLLLYGFLWEPILGMLDQRRQTVQQSLEEAEQSRAQARELHEKRRQELEDIRAGRSSLMDQARDRAEQQRQEIVEQARREAERVAEQARERLGEEVRRARMALQSDVADLVTEIAGTVLQREVKTADHARVIEEMTEQMTLRKGDEPRGQG